MMAGTTYIHEPIMIPTDSCFSVKSGMTTDEAILIKDYVIYMAKEKARYFETTSEVIMQSRRAEQEAKAKRDKETQQMLDNIDWTKAVMVALIFMMVAHWLHKTVKEIL